MTVRVVADTNILISALMFDGLPGVIFSLGLERRFTLVTSRPLLDELDKKLREKFGVSVSDADAIRKRIEDVASLVDPAFVLSEVPDDNRVLECAVEGGADLIVSGDRHLLRLGNYKGIAILTARQFLESSGLLLP